MTVFQRIRSFLFGLLMLGAAIFFIAYPDDDSYTDVIWILSTGMAVKGIKDIIYYFMMARHMVGGKIILFQGVVILDLAMFTASLSNVPKIYIFLYLIVIHAFSGVIETLRALESRKTLAGPWKLKLGHGIINFMLALACLVFIKQTNSALIIYSIGLIYSASIRIISAFRRTAFIVIK